MTIEQLEKEIDELATAYYNGEEKVSDKVYDELIEELRILDPTNKRIPGMAGEEKNPAGYKKMAHSLVTGTLSKQMTTKDFEEWFTKMVKKGTSTFNISTKMDGIGIELQFVDGSLIHAISRGDGVTGFDKAELVKLTAVKANANFTGSVRGELILRNSDFNDPYFKGKKNPRNTVSGLFNRKLSELSAKDKEVISKVHFIAYDYLGEKQLKTKSEMMSFLSNAGFEIPLWKAVAVDAKTSIKKALEVIFEARKEYDTLRSQSDQFALDGIVVFDDTIDYEDQKELVQNKATALKFDLMVGRTKLLKIDWNLSGSRLTPIAVTEPVELDGTTVQHANLVNLNVISKLGIKIGDEIIMAKAGQIIPIVIGKAN